VAHALVNLSLVFESTGDYAEARAVLERALAIYEQKLGPSHALVAQVLHNLGMNHRATGDLATAEALLQRTVAIIEADLGAEHPHLGYPLAGLAGIALDQGRASEALPLAERALQLRERAGAPAEQQAEARALVARALVATGGDRERALELARRAREEYGKTTTKDESLAKLEAWMRAQGEVLEGP
jgi:tetratricopeptide (TPR) repeat protein